MAKPPTFVYFTVTGSGGFPLDMCRYDACYPISEKDANVALDREVGSRTVTLAHAVVRDENWQRYPTNDRWQSFGWTVVGGPCTDPYDINLLR